MTAPDATAGPKYRKIGEDRIIKAPKYRVIETRRDALYWLSGPDYTVGGPFLHGVTDGLTSRRAGGLWGVFEDGLLERMVEEGLIYGSRSRWGGFSFGGLTAKGYRWRGGCREEHGNE